MLTNASFQVVKEVSQAVDGILSGVAVLILDGSDEVFVIQTKGWEKEV